MKKFFSNIILLITCIVLILSLFSCDVSPNSDYEKAKQGLIAAGYDEFLESDASSPSISQIIIAEKDDVNFDTIYIFYYSVDIDGEDDDEWLKSGASVLENLRDKWLNDFKAAAAESQMSLEEFAKKEKIDIEYYSSLEYGYGMHGNMAWYGTTLAIEAAQ